jgi:hypothetical protein
MYYNVVLNAMNLHVLGHALSMPVFYYYLQLNVRDQFVTVFSRVIWDFSLGAKRTRVGGKKLGPHEDMR